MRVLGIDCGTEYTGYGVVEQNASGRLEFIMAGAIQLSKRESMPKRLATVFTELSRIIFAASGLRPKSWLESLSIGLSIWRRRYSAC